MQFAVILAGLQRAYQFPTVDELAQKRRFTDAAGGHKIAEGKYLCGAFENLRMGDGRQAGRCGRRLKSLPAMLEIFGERLGEGGWKRRLSIYRLRQC
jgi:hypothetical protein